MVSGRWMLSAHFTDARFGTYLVPVRSLIFYPVMRVFAPNQMRKHPREQRHEGMAEGKIVMSHNFPFSSFCSLCFGRCLKKTRGRFSLGLRVYP